MAKTVPRSAARTAPGPRFARGTSTYSTPAALSGAVYAAQYRSCGPS